MFYETAEVLKKKILIWIFYLLNVRSDSRSLRSLVERFVASLQDNVSWAADTLTVVTWLVVRKT